MNRFEELTYWHKHSYGSAIRVKRSVLHKLGVFVCLITPATNWLIPFLGKLIRSDFIYRY